MSDRLRIAAACLQGMLANPNYPANCPDQFAREALAQADALLQRYAQSGQNAQPEPQRPATYDTGDEPGMPAPATVTGICPTCRQLHRISLDRLVRSGDSWNMCPACRNRTDDEMVGELPDGAAVASEDDRFSIAPRLEDLE